MAITFPPVIDCFWGQAMGQPVLRTFSYLLVFEKGIFSKPSATRSTMITQK